MKCSNLVLFLTSFMLNRTTVAATLCDYLDKTGDYHHEEYDLKREICCKKGGIFPNKDSNGSLQSCCGFESYTKDSQICCNGRKYNMTSQRRDQIQYACCGVAPIDTSNQFCCGGVPRTKTHNQNSCCAGTLMYNNNIKKCCQNYNGTIGKLASLSEECCGSTPFNSSTHFCYVKERPVKLFFDICGSKEYDTRDFICCGSTLHTKQKYRDLRCCGSGLYDNRIEQCCRTSDIPFTVDKDAFCCGKSSYNYKIQRCCNSTVLNASATQECCNGKLFDTRHEGCCAKILFNRTTHQCCGWTNIAPKNKTCCGNSGNFFSPDKEVCCGNRYTIPKSKAEDTKCCLLSNTSYNEVLEKCRPARRCGMVPYNPSTDLCCGRRRVHRNGVTNGKKCCNPGTFMFDPETELCCSSNVVRKESNRTNCRNRKKATSHVYNVTTKPYDHSNICELCQLSSRGFMASLKNGRINVCQKNIFKVKVSRVWRVKNIRKRIKYSKIRVRLGKKISLTKSKDARKRRRKVNLELLCECPEIRADMRFILLTNSDTDQGDIRLGDSDVIMPDIHEFYKVMKAKLRKCPAVVQRKLTEILQNT